MNKTPPGGAFADRQAAAAYVGALVADLGRIARHHGLDTLAYLLDIARLEAQQIAGEQGGADPAVN